MSLPAIQFTGANEALRAFTIEKFTHLEKFSAYITHIHVTFIVDKLSHIAEATIHAPKTELHARAESEDMYKTVDFLLEKLSRQLSKYKEKITQH